MAKTLLLIEDDRVLLNMYQKLFTNHGYIVDVALDGEDGLSKAISTHPDLILLDLRLPKMDGMTVLKKLRLDQWGKNAKVIILTNLDPNDITIKEVIEGHPSYYLIKAKTRTDNLLEHIKEVLSSQEIKGGM